MTAPAITPTDTQPTEFASADEGIASIARDAITQTLAEHPEPTETARDEKGRFVPKAGDAPATAESEIADLVAEAGALPPDGEPAPDEITFPEGFVAVPKVEGRELATTFAVLDKDGELEVPDLQIRFNANGKERVESLDKVVKLAQFGVYNHEREQQVQAAKQTAQQADARAQQVEQFARQLLAEREQLLSNDDAYLTARAKYEAENTPEARIQQQQQVLHQQNAVAFQQASQQGDQFFQSELAPTVDTILKALPTIGPEEIAAKLLLVSNQYEVHTPFGSILPPKHYAALRHAIATEVVPWAQQLHESRETDRKTSATKTDAEKQALQKAADQARIDAQKARNLVGKSARPGTQGRPGSTAPPPKPIRTVQDAEDSALAETLAAMR